MRKKLRELTGQWSKFRTFKLNSVIIELCTVDSFQGHEADLVFLSLTNSRSTTFLNNLNRINVALTRAKYQCVIVGNNESMREADDPLGKLAKDTPPKMFDENRNQCGQPNRQNLKTKSKNMKQKKFVKKQFAKNRQQVDKKSRKVFYRHKNDMVGVK